MPTLPLASRTLWSEGANDKASSQSSLKPNTSAVMATQRPEAPAPQNAADDSDGGSLRRRLPRAAWDCLAAHVASPEFALVLPTVSKTFCRILDGAPAWARAWAALAARRSTHLEFATCKPWNYRESRSYTKAELRALRKEMLEAHEEVMRALENDGMRTWQAREKAARAEGKRRREADNWFGMPSGEPSICPGGPWSFKGPGVSEEAARSNALPQRSSPYPNAQWHNYSDSDRDSDLDLESDWDVSDASGSGDDTESDAAKSDAGESGAPTPAEAAFNAPVHPRVLLATSQEAQYWRRLRGALEAWAARLPAAKAAAVRDFAMRASPDVFITAEAERVVLTKQGTKADLGSKLVHIATLTVNEVLVRVVVVPQCCCDGSRNESLTCSFRCPGEQWVSPIDYESSRRCFNKANDNRSSVARGDLLLDMARAVGVGALDVPELVHLLFLLAGTQPVVGHIFCEPSIVSDWIACVEAARSGELKSERRKNEIIMGPVKPESIAYEHWHKKPAENRPDLSAFGSLLMFSGYQHGPSEYTHSRQYAAYYAQRGFDDLWEESGFERPVCISSPDDDRDQPVRMRKNRN